MLKRKFQRGGWCILFLGAVALSDSSAKANSQPEVSPSPSETLATIVPLPEVKSAQTPISIAATVSKVENPPLIFPIPPFEHAEDYRTLPAAIRNKAIVPSTPHQAADGQIRLGGEKRDRMFDLDLDGVRKERHYYRVTNLFMQKNKRFAPPDSLELLELDQLADPWSPKQKNLRASLSDLDLNQTFCTVSHDYGRLNEDEMPEFRLPNLEVLSHHVRAIYNPKKGNAYGTAVVIQAKNHLRVSCFKFAKDKDSKVDPISLAEIRATLDLTDDDFQLQLRD